MKLVAAVIFCAFLSSAESVKNSGEDFRGVASVLSEIDKIDESVVLVRSPKAPHDVIGVGVYILRYVVTVSKHISKGFPTLILEFKVPNRVIKANLKSKMGYQFFYGIPATENFHDEEAVQALSFVCGRFPMPSVGTTVSWNKHGMVITKDRPLTDKTDFMSVLITDITEKIGDILFIGTTYYGVCIRREGDRAIYSSK